MERNGYFLLSWCYSSSNNGKKIAELLFGFLMLKILSGGRSIMLYFHEIMESKKEYFSYFMFLMKTVKYFLHLVLFKSRL